MNLENIFNELTDDEKVYFLSYGNVEYYKYVTDQDEFKIIISKIKKDIDLDITEWKYMLEKLFLITSKSILEEKIEERNISIFGKFLYSFSKLCLKKVDDSTELYYECYKIVKYFDGLKVMKELNNDLGDGLFFVVKNKSNHNLNILLEQHDLVQTCREYRDDFLEEYKNDVPGRISGIQYRDINLFERSYGDVKKKLLSYKKQ